MIEITKTLQATLACLILLLWNATFIAPPAMAADIPSVKPTQTFFNPDPALYDGFGYSVAIDGDAVVIGTRAKDAGGILDAGAAYLFKKSTGELLQTFSNPNPAQGDNFGFSVAIDGDAVVIGAPYKDAGPKDAGAAYLFKKSTGELLQTFSNPNPASYELFGYSVAIDGDAVVIGAPYKDAGPKDAGAAYLFKKSTGELLQTFSNPNPAVGDYFGESLAIDGDAVVIGVWRKDAGPRGAGAAYLFKKSTGELLQTFSNPNPAHYDFFGSSVAIDGDAVVIGAAEKDAGAKDAGAAYLFKKSTGELLQTFSKLNPAEKDYFGYPVAIDGDAVVIGAWRKDAGPRGAGAAYLYNIDNSTATTNTPDNSTPEDNTSKLPPTIVNIDAKINNQNNPVKQSFKAGIYKVHLINTSEGGKFDAWNDRNLEIGCDADGKNCSNGWESRYYFKSPYNKVTDSNCNKPKFGSCRYSTAAKAAANYPSDVKFAVFKDKDVNFYIYDSINLTDNQGGISLEITLEEELGKK